MIHGSDFTIPKNVSVSETEQLLAAALSDLAQARRANDSLRKELEIEKNRTEGQTLQAQKIGSEIMRLRNSKTDPLLIKELQRQCAAYRAVIVQLLEERQQRQGYRGAQTPEQAVIEMTGQCLIEAVSA